MNSSVAYLLELIVLTFFFRAMGSDRVILTLEQQVDVFEELVRDNRVEVNFTLATNACAINMLDFFKHQLNADSRLRTRIHTHTHYINTLPVYTVFRI